LVEGGTFFLSVGIGELIRTTEFKIGTPAYNHMIPYLNGIGTDALPNEYLTTQISILITEWKEGRSAHYKAGRLLRTLLTPEQLKSWDTCNYFHEQGKVTGDWYRFNRWNMEVRCVYNRGKKKSRFYEDRAYFCIHPDLTIGMPKADVTITQLLLLRTDEREFLKKANFHHPMTAEELRVEDAADQAAMLAEHDREAAAILLEEETIDPRVNDPNIDPDTLPPEQRGYWFANQIARVA